MIFDQNEKKALRPGQLVLLSKVRLEVLEKMLKRCNRYKRRWNGLYVVKEKINEGASEVMCFEELDPKH